MARVLITGGSRGIGASCVRMFCARGDSVAFFYRQSTDAAERLANETGALALQVDITDADAVRLAVDRAVEWLGGIDVLVNNAGIAQIKLFTDVTDVEWDRMMATNLDGAFYVTRAAVRYMIAQHAGKIVNVGSMWGKTGASCEVPYSASKAALRGMTMALAKELGPSNINVNCVEPGVIDTEMNAAMDEATRASLCDETPLCRIGLPEEVAAAVVFFASDAASFITGQTIGVDGGFAI